MPSEYSAGWRLEEWLDCSIKNEQEFWGAGMLRIGDGRETGRGRGRGREILNFEFWILNCAAAQLIGIDGHRPPLQGISFNI
jgi:hypothetical protein